MQNIHDLLFMNISRTLRFNSKFISVSNSELFKLYAQGTVDSFLENLSAQLSFYKTLYFSSIEYRTAPNNPVVALREKQYLATAEYISTCQQALEIRTVIKQNVAPARKDKWCLFMHCALDGNKSDEAKLLRASIRRYLMAEGDLKLVLLEELEKHVLKLREKF